MKDEMKKEKNEEVGDGSKSPRMLRLLKRRNKKAILIGLTMLAVWGIHLFIAYDYSFRFITDLFKGDVIVIASTYLTLFVIGGWILVYFLFRKYF